MERVLGIGGFFFRSRDSRALAQRYAQGNPIQLWEPRGRGAEARNQGA